MSEFSRSGNRTLVDGGERLALRMVMGVESEGWIAA